MSLKRAIFPGVPLGRRPRKPVFPIAGAWRPFGLYPVLAAPVMAGETVRGLRLRLRVISMPLRYPLGGAYLHFWWAYCPARLSVGTDIVNELSPSTTGLLETSDVPRMFSKVGQLRLIQLTYDVIVNTLIAREGQTLPAFDGARKVPRIWSDWTNNLSKLPSGLTVSELPEREIDTEGDLDIAMDRERTLLEAGSYDQFVRAFGVPEPRRDDEAVLFNHGRFWTQPTNTVEPSTGVPSSAWTWAIDTVMPKVRRVKEPGVMMLLASIRPKMLHRKADASYLGRMVGLLQWVPPTDDAQAWHAISDNDPVWSSTFKGSGSTQLLIDRQDVFGKGEAFINDIPANLPYAVPQDTAGAYNGADLAALRGEFVADADIDALFSGSTTVSRRIYYDGIAEMTVQGHVGDIRASVADGQIARER